MNQERNDALYLDIERQVNAGFSAHEIRQNLRDLGYSDEEIRTGQSMMINAAAPAQKAGGREYISLIVSGIFIVRGIYGLSNGQETWGTIMLLIGCVGLVIKLVLMVRG